jgi:hypothetical protein
MRARLRGGDDGIAMLTVLLYMLVFSILGTTLLYVSLNAIPSARHEQSYQASLAAAEAGVDDYLIRLDQDYNYATNPSDGNLAMTSDPSKCVPIAATTPGCFEYSVDTSQYATTGTLYLNSTGIVGKSSRTIRVGLRPFGFLDALSTTDYNLVDPTLFPVINNSVADTTSQCVWHAWEQNKTTGGIGPAGGCSGMLNYWVTGNTFNGPMQSNDDYYICGNPVFNDEVTSGDPSTTGPYWKDPFGGCGGDHPKFNNAQQGITGHSTVGLPPAASSLKSDVTVGGPNAGCLYTGPTAIQLNGSTMTVVSPGTKSTNPNCVGTNVPLPVNGTIYVQDTPASSADPNYSSSCPIPQLWTGDPCGSGDAFVQGHLAGQLTIAADNNIVITGSITYDSFTATAPRQVLGLIATNNVEINHTTVANSGSPNPCSGHPVYNGRCNQYGSLAFGSTGVSFTVPVVNPTVDAAILSLQHSFGVMDFSEGAGPATGNDLGTLTVNGVIAEKFMDTEGQFTGAGQVSGYGVDYTYDSRMRNGGLTPPNFLDPTKSFWHRITFAECPSEGSSGCPSS